MSPAPESSERELRPMLRLAVPVVLGELGWMAMGLVDTMMVGRVGAESIGAVSVGRAIFMFGAILGIGILLGLDTMVSNAFGARRIADCHRALVQGIYLAVLMALPLTAAVRFLGGRLDAFGIQPRVLPLAASYVGAISWALLPILLYAALRRYLQAMNLVRPVMVALISANLVNAAGNWVLIFGHLGFPALGAAGAGWTTALSSWYMVLVLAFAAVLHDREEGTGLLRVSLRLDPERLRRLLALGLPAGAQLLLEVGVFALASVLAGRLDTSSLAAHQIAMHAASVTYMVPLGISSAAAVRVGQAAGRRDSAGAARAGWTAILLAAGFMSLAAVVFVSVPRTIIRGFTADPGVLAAGVPLLYLAALFQLFDGVQVTAIGALRGAGDTRTPVLWNLLGYWVLALPVGYYLCFVVGWGATGLWVGFCAGLISVGTILVWSWARLVRRWADAASPA